MERIEAVSRLKKLEGVDLRPLADVHKITVWKEGKKNKGWAGHTIERYLGLPINSTQAPNFGSWELKIVPLKRLKSGIIKPKETMSITMIDPVNVALTTFEDSHMYLKLRRMVVCARMFESIEDISSILVRVVSFDLDNKEILSQVRDDYNLVKRTIKTEGFSALTGKMGVLIQPRTKGAGHGSTSRAFYARPGFVANILGL